MYILVIELVKEFLLDFWSAFGYLAATIWEKAIAINQTEIVASLTVFTMLLGAGLCALMVGKQVIATYGFEVRGDHDQDAMEIIWRLCLALGAIGCNSWLFNELTKYGVALGRDVTTIFSQHDVQESFLQEAVKNLIDRSSQSSLIFLSGVLIVGYTLFFFNIFLKAAEITLSKILLPLFALDLINTNSEKWNMFIFQYIINFLGFIVQMVCYQIFTYYFLRLDTSNLMDWMVALGWLFMCLKTPKWLEKYIYATGTGQAIGRGAGRLGQVLMYVGMRR